MSRKIGPAFGLSASQRREAIQRKQWAARRRLEMKAVRARRIATGQIPAPKT